MIPTPSELLARFERGDLERHELHALMAVHARELIDEMEEDHRNPAAAWAEQWRARNHAKRWVRRVGHRLVREVLVALSQVPGFPPARHLWNASHPDLPLHCFLRIRREPVFRIITIDSDPDQLHVTTEHGCARRGLATRTRFILRRDPRWQWQAERVTA